MEYHYKDKLLYHVLSLSLNINILTQLPGILTITHSWLFVNFTLIVIFINITIL
jgi:hypothetical protein